MKKIKINKAECRLCGDVIESTHRHDFKTCSCGEISVDGGTSYISRSWAKDQANIIELSEFEEDDTLLDLKSFRNQLKK